MHRSSYQSAGNAVVCLAQLRLQLQQMRSGAAPEADGVHSFVPQEGVHVRDASSSVVSTKPQALRGCRQSPQGGWDANVDIMQQLEARLQRHQEGGVKRRGELRYVVGEAYNDMKQIGFLVERFQHDIEDRLRVLQQMQADAKGRIERLSCHPEEFIEQLTTCLNQENNGCSSRHSEESTRVMSQLMGIQRTLDSIRHDLQQQVSVRLCPAAGDCGGDGDGLIMGDMWDALQAERNLADAQLSTMKEAFLIFAQETLEELEQLKRERMEAETQCVRILS